MILMDSYTVDFEPGWDEFFKKFDKGLSGRVWKKILQLRQPIKHRHLQHGLPFFVEEVAGNRILFKTFENEKLKKVFFVGTHKQYKKWYSDF